MYLMLNHCQLGYHLSRKKETRTIRFYFLRALSTII
jgi:hypothetical protein